MICLNNFGQDVGLAKDLVLRPIDFDLAAAVLAEDDFVANGDRKFATLAAVQQFARADGDDGATLGLFLS